MVVEASTVEEIRNWVELAAETVLYGPAGEFFQRSIEYFDAFSADATNQLLLLFFFVVPYDTLNLLFNIVAGGPNFSMAPTLPRLFIL